MFQLLVLLFISFIIFDKTFERALALENLGLDGIFLKKGKGGSPLSPTPLIIYKQCQEF